MQEKSSLALAPERIFAQLATNRTSVHSALKPFFEEEHP